MKRTPELLGPLRQCVAHVGVDAGGAEGEGPLGVGDLALVVARDLDSPLAQPLGDHLAAVGILAQGVLVVEIEPDVLQAVLDEVLGVVLLGDEAQQTGGAGPHARPARAGRGLVHHQHVDGSGRSPWR